MRWLVTSNHDVTHTPALYVVGECQGTVMADIVGDNQASTPYKRRVYRCLTPRCGTHIEHATPLEVIATQEVANELRRGLLNVIGASVHQWVERKLRS